jgi:HAD superfamily hydrolase (TIGR01509 family)
MAKQQTILVVDRDSDFLDWAKTRYSMALVSSGSQETVCLGLVKLGYESMFFPQVFAEDVKLGKPDPEGFHLALLMHNCKPERALVFEDSESGFQAATKASIPFYDANHFIPFV